VSFLQRDCVATRRTFIFPLSCRKVQCFMTSDFLTKKSTETSRFRFVLLYSNNKQRVSVYYETYINFTISTQNLAFRGPCVVSVFLLIYLQQDVTLHSLFISGKLLYMFRVISPPIIRSTYNCIYSIWYLSNRYCYLPL
jgi:hypothetical protein